MTKKIVTPDDVKKLMQKDYSAQDLIAWFYALPDLSDSMNMRQKRELDKLKLEKSWVNNPDRSGGGGHYDNELTKNGYT